MSIKKLLIAATVNVILLNSLISFAIAQNSTPSGNFQVDVQATVGEFFLNVSGFISPNASIVMTTTGGVFMASTVADANGNFSFSQILINRGFSGFCLQAIDFYRIGESTTCFNFPGATASITMDNLFLPPTLGLSRTDIASGESVTVFGYTMPGATVTLHLSDGTTRTTAADSNGYYEFVLSSLGVGTYDLYATAEYNSQPSLQPSSTSQLHVLGWSDQLLAWLKELWKKLLSWIRAIPIWAIGIPLLILIIILILKLWPEKFTFIYESKVVKFLTRLFRRARKLHHAWFVGY